MSSHKVRQGKFAVRTAEGFEKFMTDYKAGLAVERAAVENL